MVVNQVVDRPAFRHRGLLIDTSRNYINVPTIKSIISGMSYDKLNVFRGRGLRPAARRPRPTGI